MIPVEQQVMAVFDEHGDNVQRGDCMRACVASLFELPLEDVPHFVERDTWYGDWINWLNDRGLTIWDARVRTADDDETKLTGWPSDGYWMATVKSPRGRSRCPVCNGDKVALRTWDDELRYYIEHDTPQPCGYCSETGLVPSLHCVVMHGPDLVWDPHPQRDMGHLGFVSGELFRVIDPARLTYSPPPPASARVDAGPPCSAISAPRPTAS